MSVRYPVPQHQPRNPAGQSRIISNRPTARAGSSTFAITFGATTSGTASASPYRLGVAVGGATNQWLHAKAAPAGAYKPQRHRSDFSRRVYGPTARASSSTFAITFGATTSGTAGTASYRLGNAVAGGTNQWAVVKPAPQHQAASVEFGSRGFVYYHAAPPIYRVVLPGGTNQGFQFEAVTQPPPVRVGKPRIVSGATARRGASTFAITFGAVTSGSVPGAGKNRLLMGVGQ